MDSLVKQLQEISVAMQENGSWFALFKTLDAGQENCDARALINQADKLVVYARCSLEQVAHTEKYMPAHLGRLQDSVALELEKQLVGFAQMLTQAEVMLSARLGDASAQQHFKTLMERLEVKENKEHKEKAYPKSK